MMAWNGENTSMGQHYTRHHFTKVCFETEDFSILYQHLDVKLASNQKNQTSHFLKKFLSLFKDTVISF